MFKFKNKLFSKAYNHREYIKKHKKLALLFINNKKSQKL